MPQAHEEPTDSLARWVREDEDAKIENEDMLVYVAIGTSHIPRPEDWPVYVCCFPPSFLSLISWLGYCTLGKIWTLMGFGVHRMPIDHIRPMLKPNLSSDISSLALSLLCSPYQYILAHFVVAFLDLRAFLWHCRMVLSVDCWLLVGFDNPFRSIKHVQAHMIS